MSEGHKYIFVVGGVMSGVGKGVASSSVGRLLEEKGFTVNLMKIDPYLNVDAGTMNPTEHGEVFVLDSGLETDQDMGNYERFLNRTLGPENYMTSGMVYKAVIDRERNLGYGGKCVEAIPHVRNEIVERVVGAAEASHSSVSVIEVGGTVGDFQNAMFIEAGRFLKLQHPKDVLFVMVAYLPVPKSIGEMKTRPAQHAMQELNSYGVQADILVARSEAPLDVKRKEKLAVSCGISKGAVISAPDVDSIYDVPVNFDNDGLGDLLLEKLNLSPKKSEETAKEWKEFVAKVHNGSRMVEIAVVGKYFDTGDFVLSDAYLSVIEAIKFSSYAQGLKPSISWLNAKDIESGKVPLEELKKFGGIIVPGGFGESGIEGKLKVIEYARREKIPYLGLCYGMQLMVVEYARNVAGLAGAHTVEINPETKYPVIAVMESQKKNLAEGHYGGTMRLGAYPCMLGEGTIARAAYGNASEISERHRHRYEVNPEYVPQVEKAGLVFSGKSPDGVLMEIAELPKSVHPFFLGTQFHPEFLARPLTPHPLFTEFIRAAGETKTGKSLE